MQSRSSKDSNYQVSLEEGEISIYPMVGALLLISAMFFLFVFDVYQSSYVQTAIDRKALRIVELGGKIDYLEQTLAMSVELAAATGNPNWEKKYREVEPQVEASLEEAQNLASDPNENEILHQMSAADLKSVELENRVFDAVRAGQPEKAGNILSSEEYKNLKKLSAAGINRLDTRLEILQQLRLDNSGSRWGQLLIISTLFFSLIVLLAIVRSLFNSRKKLLANFNANESATHALHLSEMRFRELFENANDIIFTLDLQGNFTSLNKMGEIVTGYPREEMLKMNISQFVVPETFAFVRQMLEKKLEIDAPTIYETEIITKSGNRVTLEINSILIVENGTAIGIHGIARDITESLQAAENKRKFEQYQNLFKHANDAILILDPNTEVVLEVNDRACELYGRTRASFVGQGMEEIVQNISRGRGKIEKLLRDGVYDEFESVHLRADGTLLDLVINAAVIEYQGRPAILTINRDISVRKQMEKDLREREEHLMSVANSARDAIVSADSQGNIVFWNSGAEKIFGYDAQEIVGKSLSILMPQKYREAHKRGISQYLDIGEKKIAGKVVELEGRRKNGTEFPLELSLGVWGTANGRYFTSIVRDITERRRIELIETLHDREVALRAEVAANFAASNESLQVNLTRCVEVIVKNLDAAFARIWTLNEKENVLELQASAGIYTHLNGSHARVPVGSFKIGRIAEERLPHITNDVLNDVYVSDKEWARQSGMRSFAGFPLLIEGKLVGVVAMFARHNLDDKTLDALAGVADIISQNIERRRTLDALTASEQQYRLLGEGIMHQVWTAQPNGTLDYLNRRTLEFFGYTRREAGSVKLRDIVHPEDVERVINQWKYSIQTSEPFEAQLRLKRKDGNYFWCMSRATAGRDADGKIVRWFGTNTDIHEQKLAEGILRESEERFRLLVEGVEDYAILMLDPSGYIISWNTGAERVKKYTAEEIIGNHFRIFYTPEDQERKYPEEELEIATAKGRFEDTGWRVRKDGSHFLANVIITAMKDDKGNLQGFSKITRDITAREKSAEALRESEYKLRTLLDSMNEGLLQVNNEEVIEFVNDRFCEMIGYEREELLGKVTYEILPGNEEWEIINKAKQDRLKGVSGQYEMRLKKKTGEDVWVIIGGAPIINAKGEIIGSMGSHTDITVRKRIEDQLSHDAFHDGLTGLANRSLFMDHLRITIERSRRNTHSSFAVLFLDFDRFKVINDSLGHSEGDKFLRLVARRLETALRPGDLVARLGGDEFTILLSELSSESEAINVAERIQTDLKKSFDLGGQEIFISASIGITLGDVGYLSGEDMLRDADIAMYQAKAGGRAQYRMFDRTMREHASNKLQLETEMRQALEREEFEVHYQPIMNLKTGSLTGFESLVRWRHPKRGMIPPLEFISAAEENNLILPLGRWILRESCRQLREWQISGLECTNLTISVNLSSKQFSQADLADQVAEIIKTTRLDPRCLKLEITESQVMENSEQAVRLMNNLRALGVELSIDDFGTGYSSLSYLHRLPVNYLKVDRSFVTRMLENQENSEIVSTIIKLAQNLKLKVIAEGIETSAQLAHLKDLNCEFGQGYFFSKPIAAAAATNFIKDILKKTPILMEQSFIENPLNM